MKRGVVLGWSDIFRLRQYHWGAVRAPSGPRVTTEKSWGHERLLRTETDKKPAPSRSAREGSPAPWAAVKALEASEGGGPVVGRRRCHRNYRSCRVLHHVVGDSSRSWSAQHAEWRHQDWPRFGGRADRGTSTRGNACSIVRKPWGRGGNCHLCGLLLPGVRTIWGGLLGAVSDVVKHRDCDNRVPPAVF